MTRIASVLTATQVALLIAFFATAQHADRVLEAGSAQDIAALPLWNGFTGIAFCLLVGAWLCGIVLALRHARVHPMWRPFVTPVRGVLATATLAAPVGPFVGYVLLFSGVLSRAP